MEFSNDMQENAAQVEKVARDLGAMMRRVDLLLDHLDREDEDVKASFTVMVEAIVARADKERKGNRDVFTFQGMCDCLEGYDALRVLLERALIEGAEGDA